MVQLKHWVTLSFRNTKVLHQTLNPIAELWCKTLCRIMMSCYTPAARCPLDSGNLAMLCLLDLSAAFDSVDHDTLLQPLQKSYGLRGAVADWFASYLSGRTQSIHSSSTTSAPSAVAYGVPQGSVRGPILLLLYVADLLQLVKRHQLHPHAYADDTQIYGFCRPSDVDDLSSRVSHCIDEVSAWMKANRLQLNPPKTEVLWCSSARHQHQIKSTTHQSRRCPQSGILVSTSTLMSP